MLLPLIVTLLFVTLVNTVFQLTQFDLAYRYWRSVWKKQKPTTRPIDREQLPAVTIQLPMFNESIIAPRILEAVSRIDYPRDRLQIQILDDSTDHSPEIIARILEELRQSQPELNIEYLHRTDRQGFKAGALQAAMPLVTGEFIAIFDADFIPQPDFLTHLLPYFDSPEVAVVQSRWGHLNAHDSVLTQAQQFFLDGHHSVEQNGRNRAGYFITFNGTAGIWRRSAMEAAGGWSADTLVEDLDLSYRTQSLGYRIVYVEDYVTPGELPNSVSGLRVQLFRWFKGNAQVGLKILGKVWQQPLPLSVKIHATAQLFAPFTMLSSLVMLLITGALPLILHAAPEHADLVKLCYMGFVWVPAVLLVYGTPRIRFDEGPWYVRLVKLVPRTFVFMAMMTGLSCQSSIAVLEAVFKRANQWVVTPKGFSQQSSKKKVRRKLAWYVWPDAFVILYLMASIVIAWKFNFQALMVIEATWLVGYLWLFGGAVWEAYGTPAAPSIVKTSQPENATVEGRALVEYGVNSEGGSESVTTAPAGATL